MAMEGSRLPSQSGSRNSEGIAPVELSRRLFLGGAIALVGAAVLPRMVLSAPVVWGDGIHDDWAGLDALFNGRKAQILTDSVTISAAKEVHMLHGNFILSRTLRLRTDSPRIIIRNSVLTWSAPVETCIYFEGTNYPLPRPHNLTITRQ